MLERHRLKHEKTDSGSTVQHVKAQLALQPRIVNLEQRGSSRRKP